jgi:hypothetical protein
MEVTMKARTKMKMEGIEAETERISRDDKLACAL